ncbi:MAG: aspartate aminotransferase family protein [Alphaproteobacteria bacterium]|nr:aspartate aminotransferase family protein [Alphaproteobacteria bacterium]
MKTLAARELHPNEPVPAAAIGGTQDVFYARRNAARLPMMVRAEGIHFWDEAGERYIDASCGPMVSSLGHGNRRVIDAMAAQALRLDYVFSRVGRNQPNQAYAERLARLAGPGFERVSLSSGGSEAMERALQFARQFAVATGEASRRRVISLDPSYHGATIATLAISGNNAGAAFFDGFATIADTVPAPMTYRLPAGHTAESWERDCADALERKIQALGPRSVLAFAIEPVGGLSTGALVPSAAYMRAIREVCTRHGVLLIFDEVLCGAGRTGRFFAMEHWPDARPDILVVAKAIGAGYAPLGATLVPAAMADRLAALTGFDFSYSYNANPIACAVGLAVLDEFAREDLVAQGRARGGQLEAGLRSLAASCPMVGDVRGRGMLWAVELVRDKASRAMLPPDWGAVDRVRNHALAHGLLLYSRATSGGRYGQWFMVAPPLVASAAEIDDILARIARTLEDFTRWAATAA